MKISRTIALTAVLLSLSSSAFACSAFCFNADEVNNAVHCKVKDVHVLAKSSNDCAALEGEVEGKYEAKK